MEQCHPVGSAGLVSRCGSMMSCALHRLAMSKPPCMRTRIFRLLVAPDLAATFPGPRLPRRRLRTNNHASWCRTPRTPLSHLVPPTCRSRMATCVCPNNRETSPSFLSSKATCVTPSRDTSSVPKHMPNSRRQRRKHKLASSVRQVVQTKRGGQAATES